MTKALRKISEHISSVHVVFWDLPLPSNANIRMFLDRYNLAYDIKCLQFMRGFSSLNTKSCEEFFLL